MRRIPRIRILRNRSNKPKVRIVEGCSPSRVIARRLREVSGETRLRGCRFPSVRLLSSCTSNRRAISSRRLALGGGGVHRALTGCGVGIASIRTIMNPAIALCEIVLTPKIGISTIRGLCGRVNVTLKIGRIHIIILASYINVRITGERPSVIPLGGTLGSSSFEGAGCSLPVTVKCAVAGGIGAFSLTSTPRLLITNTARRNGSINLGIVVSSLLCTGRPSRLGFIFVSPGVIRFATCGSLLGRCLTIVPVTTDRRSRERGTVIGSTGRTRLILGSLYVRVSRHCGLVRVTKIGGLSLCGSGCGGEELLPASKRGCLPCLIIIVSRCTSLAVTKNTKPRTEGSTGGVRASVVHLTRGKETTNVRIVVTAREPAIGIVANLVGAGFPAEVTFGIISHISSTAVLSAGNTRGLVNEKSVLCCTKISVRHIRYTCIAVSRVGEVAEFVNSRANCGGYCGAPCCLPIPRSRSNRADKNSVSVRGVSPLFRRTTQVIIVARGNSASSLREHLNVKCTETNHIVSRLRNTSYLLCASPDPRSEIRSK